MSEERIAPRRTLEPRALTLARLYKPPQACLTRQACRVRRRPRARMRPAMRLARQTHRAARAKIKLERLASTFTQDALGERLRDLTVTTPN